MSEIDGKPFPVEVLELLRFSDISYGPVLHTRVLLQLKRLFLITSPSQCTFFHGKTLGELGTGTVNLFLVGLLKVEKVPFEGYVMATFFKEQI